jgi:hypothetical protein
MGFNDAKRHGFVKLYRNHPFYEASGVADWLEKVFHQQEFRTIFNSTSSDDSNSLESHQLKEKNIQN